MCHIIIVVIQSWGAAWDFTIQTVYLFGNLIPTKYLRGCMGLQRCNSKGSNHLLNIEMYIVSLILVLMGLKYMPQERRINQTPFPCNTIHIVCYMKNIYIFFHLINLIMLKMFWLWNSLTQLLFLLLLLPFFIYSE